MTKPSNNLSLREILEKLFNGGVHKSLSGLANRDKYIQEATQAIKELYLSLPSMQEEPQKFGKSHRPSDVVGLDRAIVRNQLRAELRKEIENS